MNRTRWLLLGAVAALIASMWWASRPNSLARDTSAGAKPSADYEFVPATAVGENRDAREVVRNVDEPTRDHAATRIVRLQLARFPDEAPLANAQLEIAPLAAAPASSWLITDAGGRLEVEVSVATTTLDINAAGYEPRELQLEPSQPAMRVLLTPSSGLFGRVVDREGAPVAGAEVRLEVSRRILQNTHRVTRSQSEVNTYEVRSNAASATTNVAGFYFIAYATNANVERARVLAMASNAVGTLDVELPRAPTQLDDIRVSPQPSLTIRVVDTSGLPVAGAAVSSPENPRRAEEMKVDGDGVVKWFAPSLPASFTANAPGMRQREQRFDGVVVARGTKVGSLETRVEIVIESVPNLRVRALDAETRQPVFLASGRAALLRDGGEAGFTDFQLDAHGEATVLLVGRDRNDGAAETFDVARLWVTATDYREDLPTDVDLHALSSSTPIEILLEPEPATVALRGRVVRGSESVTGLQVGVRVQRRSEGPQPRGDHYKRTMTDTNGRFVVRWPRDSEDQVVGAFPHWTRWDEFGFIGPLDVDVAIASEQVLELKPAVRAPAILRGVSKGGRYLYFVSIVDGEVNVSTTINGAPITVDTDGEARVTLLLPSDRRSRVSVGFSTGGSYTENAANARDFDPSRPGAPLVFELQPFFADITGRAVGFSADEIARLSVAFVPPGEQQTRAVVRCNADATFRIHGVPRGSGELLLVLDGLSPTRATVLARMLLTLQGNVENLQLTRDPASLPETSTERR